MAAIIFVCGGAGLIGIVYKVSGNAHLLPDILAWVAKMSAGLPT